MDTRYRVLGVALLLVGTVGVCVWYGATDRWSYPTPAEIASDPAEYDGERVLLFPGEIETLDAATGRLSVRAGPLDVRVRGVDPATLAGVDRAAAIQVYGTLREEASVLRARRLVFDYRNGTDRTYVHAMSALGGLVAAARFLQYWRVDLRRLCFVRRGGD